MSNYQPANVIIDGSASFYGFKVGDWVTLVSDPREIKFRIQKIFVSEDKPFLLSHGARVDFTQIYHYIEKNNRPSFSDIFMDLAKNLANRSTCSRKKVGCVISSIDYSQIYGIGYNGSYKGGPNYCDSTEPGNCGCLHAEDNALLKTNVGSEVPKIMYITMIPCKTCAKRIINKGGFKTVYYLEEYRCLKGKDILEQSGIKVIKWK